MSTEHFEPYYSTRPLPGVAEEETDSLIEALDAYRDFVAEHRTLLSDEWQDAASKLERERAATELRENGKVDDKRPTVIEEWSRERPRVLARLDVMREEISRLDRIAQAAIKSQAPAANAPAVERVKSAMAAYEDAVTAMEKSIAEVKASLNHARHVQSVIRTGAMDRDHGAFGTAAFGGREDVALYELQEAIKQVRKRAAHVLNGGVRYVPGQEVMFSTATGIVHVRLTADAASRLNAGDEQSARLLLSLDKSAVPVLGVENE